MSGLDAGWIAQPSPILAAAQPLLEQARRDVAYLEQLEQLERERVGAGPPATDATGQDRIRHAYDEAAKRGTTATPGAGPHSATDEWDRIRKRAIDQFHKTAKTGGISYRDPEVSFLVQDPPEGSPHHHRFEVSPEDARKFLGTDVDRMIGDLGSFGIPDDDCDPDGPAEPSGRTVPVGEPETMPTDLGEAWCGRAAFADGGHRIVHADEEDALACRYLFGTDAPWDVYSDDEDRIREARGILAQTAAAHEAAHQPVAPEPAPPAGPAPPEPTIGPLQGVLERARQFGLRVPGCRGTREPVSAYAGADEDDGEVDQGGCAPRADGRHHDANLRIRNLELQAAHERIVLRLLPRGRPPWLGLSALAYRFRQEVGLGDELGDHVVEMALRRLIDGGLVEMRRRAGEDGPELVRPQFRLAARPDADEVDRRALVVGALRGRGWQDTGAVWTSMADHPSVDLAEILRTLREMAEDGHVLHRDTGTAFTEWLLPDPLDVETLGPLTSAGEAGALRMAARYRAPDPGVDTGKVAAQLGHDLEQAGER